jgi:hypothetical protein
VRLQLYLHSLNHHSHRPDPKRVKSTPPSGLIANWQKVTSQPATKQTRTSNTDVDTWSTRTATSSRANSEPEDVSAFGFGGIPSDDENIELDSAGSMKYKVRYAYLSWYQLYERLSNPSLSSRLRTFTLLHHHVSTLLIHRPFPKRRITQTRIFPLAP